MEKSKKRVSQISVEKKMQKIGIKLFFLRVALYQNEMEMKKGVLKKVKKT